MCYAKPGPRCASSAAKRLTRISDNRSDYSAEEYQEALLDYYSTPAGLSLLDLRDAQKTERSDLNMSRGEMINVAEFRVLAEAYRDKKMASISGEASLTDHHEDDTEKGEAHPPLQGDFLADDEVRVSSPEVRASYTAAAQDFINRIPIEGLLPLRWITSDGSGVVNTYLSGGYEEVEAKVGFSINKHRDPKTDEVPQESIYSEAGVKRTIETLTQTLNDMKLDEPVVVYRGIKAENFGLEARYDGEGEEAELRLKEVASKFPEGSIYQTHTFSSTSADPLTAFKFCDGDIVLEIKAQKAAPIGGISNWGYSEKEFLLNRDTKYRVSAVKNVVYKGNGRSKKDFSVTVVQMEEVD